MGLAQEHGKGLWELALNVETTLRALGERGDVIKAMHRVLRGQQRELVLFAADTRVAPIFGRIVATGYVDELDERAYVIVDGIDGRAHHVPIGQRDPGELPVGGIVEIRPTPQRAADRNIAALGRDRIYRTEEHRRQIAARDDLRHHPDAIIDAHVRRLEALRRAGIGTDAAAANVGFGATVKEALCKRVDFLVRAGFPAARWRPH